MKEIILTSSILILVIAALRRLFRGKVRQSLIYGVWLLVALRLLIPVQFGSFRFSFLTPAQPLTEAITEISQAPVSGPTRQEIYQNIEQLYIQQGQPVSTPQIQQEIQTQVEQSITVPTLGQIAGVVWLVGVGAMALWFFLVNLRFQRRLRRDAKALDGAQSPIPVLVSEKISSPCLVGLFRPAIYLTPVSAQPHTARHVLAHELTHYRHRDHIWSLVRCICLCIYWFDPLVWLAAFLSRRDCELACDEGALNLLGEEERIAYGKTLLEIVSQASKHTHLLQTATTMNETKRQLKERVSFIVKKPKVWISAAVCLVLVCAICFGCALGGGEITEPSHTEEHLTQTTAPTNTTDAPNLTTPTQETGPMGGVLLTEEEIRQVNIATAQMDGLTNLYFLQPESVDLGKLLSSLPSYRSAEPAELDDIQDILTLSDRKMANSNWVKYQKEQVDEILMRHLGLTSEQLYVRPTTGAVYLEEYDCYFRQKSESVHPTTFLCDSGEVIGNWAYLYGANSSTGKRSVLTMHQKDGQWYVYAHLPANMVTAEGSTPLTAEQLLQVNEAFYPLTSTERADGSVYAELSITNPFLLSTYSCPEEMDLTMFLRNHPCSVAATDEERATVYAAGHGGAQCNKYDKNEIDQILLSYMGITSDVLYHGDERELLYLEEYNAYFNSTSDFLWNDFDCFGGEICGDVAYLYSERAVLTLVQRDGTWYIYSHMPLDSSTPTP